ncbi:hypothetical protein ZIOFF_037413 [Zingiber officinale]|uniref:Trichome birefringence-like C-terminal domain-containing protein n=1 Tax=Zingiber officinale TaxID=94328 RepID=A0A8J5GBJ4_ZINOF|nr:hypothetical protein ZIOFF_037413 [Zingiber officinale]
MITATVLTNHALLVGRALQQAQEEGSGAHSASEVRPDGDPGYFRVGPGDPPFGPPVPPQLSDKDLQLAGIPHPTFTNKHVPYFLVPKGFLLESDPGGAEGEGGRPCQDPASRQSLHQRSLLARRRRHGLQHRPLVDAPWQNEGLRLLPAQRRTHGGDGTRRDFQQSPQNLGSLGRPQHRPSPDRRLLPQHLARAQEGEFTMVLQPNSTLLRQRGISAAVSQVDGEAGREDPPEDEDAREVPDARAKEPKRFADCSHWCLPGLPDTWNELLFASLL